MAKKADFMRAIQAVGKNGILLVFPLANQTQPHSIWRELYPRTKMRWEWDESGDDRVARLWRLREELSRSNRVIYAKWFRGRATFFSREIFVALLAAIGTASQSATRLSRDARELLSALEMDSPQSTKELKRSAGFLGKTLERRYERGMKELWANLLVVGYGERDDGAFPSLLIGATSILFEDLWQEALRLAPSSGVQLLDARLGGDSLFKKQIVRLLKDKELSQAQTLGQSLPALSRPRMED